MTNLTTKKTQQDYIKSAVRFPPNVYQELKAAAAHNGRSMNAEILARVQLSPVDIKLDEIARQNSELRKMVQQLLDAG